MKSHPLDSPKFREWYKEQDEEYMEYGIYDSRWAELFDQFLEDEKEASHVSQQPPLGSSRSTPGH